MVGFNYKFSRFLFGFIMCLISLKTIFEKQSLSSLNTLLKNNLKDVHSEGGLVSYINFSFLSEEHNKLIQSFIDFTPIEKNSEDTIKFIYFLLFFGGLMCMLGEPLSRFLIVTAIVLDLALLHNFKFFVSENSKGTMLKYIAFLGGALHIA